MFIIALDLLKKVFGSVFSAFFNVFKDPKVLAIVAGAILVAFVIHKGLSLEDQVNSAQLTINTQNSVLQTKDANIKQLTADVDTITKRANAKSAAQSKITADLLKQQSSGNERVDTVRLKLKQDKTQQEQTVDLTQTYYQAVQCAMLSTAVQDDKSKVTYEKACQ